MGILMKMLTLPVMGPINATVWIAEKLTEQAEQETYDEGAVRAQLMELELHFDLGEISEDAYLAAEEVLLDRLRIIREYQATKLQR
jgi:gas vesicle protein GvpG